MMGIFRVVHSLFHPPLSWFRGIFGFWIWGFKFSFGGLPSISCSNLTKLVARFVGFPFLQGEQDFLHLTSPDGLWEDALPSGEMPALGSPILYPAFPQMKWCHSGISGGFFRGTLKPRNGTSQVWTCYFAGADLRTSVLKVHMEDRRQSIWRIGYSRANKCWSQLQLQSTAILQPHSAHFPPPPV